MEGGGESRYWCHMCSHMVNPIMEIESINCPICLSGFVEEMAPEPTPENETPLDLGLGLPNPDRALSLWAPILLGMMTNPQRRRFRRLEFDDVDEEEEIDRQLNIIMQRRQSRLMTSELNYETIDTDPTVLVNPFNQTQMVPGSYDSSDDSQNRVPLGSLSDYLMGPGLDLLLQHLAENDPNRYGTPPAKKEAVEALTNLKIKEKFQCCICLDECEVGTEIREMPCKHKFHGECILAWLELHSSCPMCRYQLAFDESKIDFDGLRNNNGNGNGRRSSIPNPWRFRSLFSSDTGNGNSSSTSPPGPSTNVPN